MKVEKFRRWDSIAGRERVMRSDFKRGDRRTANNDLILSNVYLQPNLSISKHGLVAYF
jgi:hypothetical protein